MDINLKVSPAELEAKATDFKGVMSQIKTLTDDMMADVTGLSSTWTGDASAAYIVDAVFVSVQMNATFLMKTEKQYQ